MKPKDYLFQNHITITQAARELGYSRPYVTDVLNEKIIPGVKFAQAFQEWTHNQVLATDLLRLNNNHTTNIFTTVKNFFRRGHDAQRKEL